MQAFFAGLVGGAGNALNTACTTYKPGKESLHRQGALATDDTAAHAGLAGEADEALHVRHREPAIGLRTGHPLQLHIDLLGREIAARRAVDDAAFDPRREQLAVL